MTKFTNLLLSIFVLIMANSFANTYNTFEQSISAEVSYDVQRVRIDFTTPTGVIRHLLLGFTPDNTATDGYDYGYDALTPDILPDDLNWMLNNERYIIQGVGAFDDSKKYELGMFLTNGGDIKIDLFRLENFENPIDIFIYDALLNSYTQINESSYSNNLDSGDYLNRFYIVFKSGNTTEIPPTIEENISEINEVPLPVDDFSDDYSLIKNNIKYISNKKELHINSSNNKISNIEIFDLQGHILPLEYNTRNKGVTKLSLEHFNPNYYIVLVTTDNGLQSSKKIVVN